MNSGFRISGVAIGFAIMVAVGCRHAGSGTTAAGGRPGTSIPPAGGSNQQDGITIPPASGGTGGADTSLAGAGTTSGKAGASWLADDSLWTPVDTLPGCSTSVAQDPAAIWPGFDFTECGVGCREARLLPGDVGSVAAILGTAARVVSGTLNVSLSARTTDSPPTYLLGTFSFGNGTPSLLIRETSSSCIAQVAGRGSLSSFRIMPRQGDFEYRLGWFETKSARLRWLSPLLTTVMDAYDFDDGWGGIDAFSELLGAANPDQAVLSSLYTTNGSIYYPSSNGGVVLFAEWLGNMGRVLSWQPGSDPSPVATGSWRPVRVGLSGERVGWLGAMIDPNGNGNYDSATLYACDRPAQGDSCRIETGPALPITSSGGILAAQGRYVATNGCVDTGCDIYLADFGASALYRVRSPHSGHGAEVIGLSDGALFVADYSETVRGSSDFDALVRYDLAELDHFATRL